MDTPNPAINLTEKSDAGNGPVDLSPKPPSLGSNLAWRAVTNWSSQLISWAALFVTVRLLSPSDFGLVGMSVVLYWYLKFLGTFGIPATVLRHRNLNEETLAQLNTMGVAFGVGSFLISCLLAWPASLFFKTPRMIPVVIVTCVGLISLGVRSVPEGLMNKHMRIKSLSFFDAARDIMSAAVTVLLAWLGFHYWALVLGNLLSEIARTAIVLAVQRHRYAWPRLAVIREPLAFGCRVMGWTFAWSTYSTLDNVTAGRVLGQSALGLYGMAWNLANTPLEKIVSLVTTVVPAYLSRVQTDLPALRYYLRSLTEVISLATFPGTVGVALVAPQAVPLLMGPKWNGMIAPLQVLSAYATFRAIVALLPKLLTAIGHAGYVLRVEVVGLVLMPFAFWFGSHWGIKGIALGWVFAYPVVALLHYWKTLKSIEMDFRDYFRALRPSLDGCIVMTLAVLGLQRLGPMSHSRWLNLILEIMAGAVAYLATIMLLHRARVMYFLDLAKKIRPGRSKPREAFAQS
ncbi:MAG TPA: lipopolysaccharide biosynthesis protein [Candidatus Solibacter sp.]|nr:lipopolysaccharide biosynthesis protein [Candidatus Solibacter sp.]